MGIEARSGGGGWSLHGMNGPTHLHRRRLVKDCVSVWGPASVVGCDGLRGNTVLSYLSSVVRACTGHKTGLVSAGGGLLPV